MYGCGISKLNLNTFVLYFDVNDPLIQMYNLTG